MAVKTRATLVLLLILAGMIALALFAARGRRAPTSDIAVIESDTLLASQGGCCSGRLAVSMAPSGSAVVLLARAVYAVAGHRTTGLNAARWRERRLPRPDRVDLVRRAHPVVTIAVTRLRPSMHGEARNC